MRVNVALQSEEEVGLNVSEEMVLELREWLVGGRQKPPRKQKRNRRQESPQIPVLGKARVLLIV